MVVLNRIYTKTGDGGQTRLASGAPVSKSDARIEAMGAVDELNAVIGVARLHSGQNDRIDAMLGRIQNELFDLGADLATPLEPAPAWEALRILDSQVERLEQEIDWMNESLKPLDSFILPGGAALSAHLHLARTVARRAEREAVRLVEGGEAVNGPAVRYLNRLSDHLFVAARRANANGAGDVKWRPGATR
ncbi:cob(I)yrinic acid a,c-diamide adenosyltransferase [Brevundimonas sp.]|uniref:cob(I)yrinic acid a,c-diamide adenosyltransferase n=1 Tax=Brevundimonas sp. TaxID=1871086 RepID=UPI003F70A3C4